MARTKSLSRQLQITLEGPFFDRDPTKTFRANIRDLMDALADEGEQAVKAQLAPHSRSGRTVAGVKGRTSNLTGKRWAVSAVISQTHVYPWAKPIAPKAQYRGGKLEAKTRAFAKTAGAMRRSRKVLAANLTKGME